jgi:hypothetical protein
MGEIQETCFARPDLPRGEHQAGRELRGVQEIIAQKRGFVVAPWDGTEETEQKIKEDTKATIRLLPSSARRARTSSPASQASPPSSPGLTEVGACSARRYVDSRIASG